MTLRTQFSTMRTEFQCTIVKLYVIGLSDRIIHMTMKIAETPKYEDEKDTFTQTGYF